ncbi:MAG: cell division protein FtsL, partial [Rhodocyclaceae bacterium]|nr:cell division protein FtsL [Rhodocyclaceae bacterium]
QARMRQLEVEWGQLQLEQSTWAAHVRIEKIARQRLRMQPPTFEQILVIGGAP